MAALVLLRLAGLAVEPRYAELARGALGPMQPLLAGYPQGFAQWLIALEYALSHPREIAIVGDHTADGTQDLLKLVYGHYRPCKVVALRLPNDDGEAVVPLLAGRGQLEGRPTAFVCRRFTCQRPVNTPRELAAQLGVESAEQHLA